MFAKMIVYSAVIYNLKNVSVPMGSKGQSCPIHLSQDTILSFI